MVKKFESFVGDDYEKLVFNQFLNEFQSDEKLSDLNVEEIKSKFDRFIFYGAYDIVFKKYEEIIKIVEKVDMLYINERFYEFWDDYPYVGKYEKIYLLYGNIDAYDKPINRKYNGSLLIDGTWTLRQMLRAVLFSYKAPYSKKLMSRKDVEKFVEMMTPALIIAMNDWDHDLERGFTSYDFSKKLNPFIERYILPELDYSGIIEDKPNTLQFSTHEIKILLK